MRAFVRMRKLLDSHKELSAQLKKLENRLAMHDDAINKIFEAIRQLMLPLSTPGKKVGYKRKDEND